MENNSTISVWLILEDGVNKGRVALQRRFTNDSSPFVCQSTWAGGIKQGETPEDVVARECKEELGEKFFEKFDFSKIKLFEKVSFCEKGDNWEVCNYLGTVSEEELKKVKMHHEAFNDFVFVSKDDLVYSIATGKDPKNNMVLFSDQYEILKKLLQ